MDAHIKKVYVPKYIFPLEKICFSFVNMLFSMIALLVIILVTGAPIHPSMAAIGIPLCTVFVFCMGVGLFLSAAAVYFRDVMHFWSVIITALTYATPLFYPESIWRGTFMMYAGRCNPIYWYVTTFRECVLYGNLPSTLQITLCSAFAAIAMVGGVYVFNKSQDNFILHI